jgi:hypothetical protein
VRPRVATEGQREREERENCDADENCHGSSLPAQSH